MLFWIEMVGFKDFCQEVERPLAQDTLVPPMVSRRVDQFELKIFIAGDKSPWLTTC